MKIAVFPGSFDPFTLGHEDVVKRSLPLFDKIIISIGLNTQKSYLFPLEQRLDWIRRVFKEEPRVVVDHYEGLTINYCKQVGASHIIRGVRSSADFEYEKTIAHLNEMMIPEIDTILILTRPELAPISSTIVREIIRGRGDISRFVPKEIASLLTF